MIHHTLGRSGTERWVIMDLYNVHRLKYKVYLHNIARDSRKKEEVFRKGGQTQYNHVKQDRWNREILKYRNKFIYKGDIYSIHIYTLYSMRNNENKYRIDTKSNTTKYN